MTQQTQIPTSGVFRVTIETVGKTDLTATVPVFRSKHPTTFYQVSTQVCGELFPHLKGEVMLAVTRGNQKQNTEGRFPWDFFWDIKGWDDNIRADEFGAAPPPPVAGSAPRDGPAYAPPLRTPSPAPIGPDTRDEGMARGNATNAAAAVVAAHVGKIGLPPDDDDVAVYARQILNLRDRILWGAVPGAEAGEPELGKLFAESDEYPPPDPNDEPGR